MDLVKINEQLKSQSPEAIIEWALSVAKQPVVTTNFRPFESAILHAVSAQSPTIPVLWCDTGYNTPDTYRSAKTTIDQLSLNLDLYVPAQTVAFRNVTLGIPEVDTPAHDEFTKQVKLEPFSRAMANYQPDVWFTNLRKDQTDHRNNMDAISKTKDGILKVCPFFYWSERELNDYIESHSLHSEDNYYDPTKALANRECGLHT